MYNFEFQELPLQGSFLIKNAFSEDCRGGFIKLYEKNIYENEGGISVTIQETFISVSMRNVIRGLHFQIRNPQAKVVSVVQGNIFDVLVDLRPDSSTFGQWNGYELSASNHCSLYIPKGFAHGFLANEDHSVVLYQCDDKYDKETDTGIRFDDIDLAIQWPVDNIEDTIHSKRDLQLMSFKEYCEMYCKCTT